MTKAILLSGVAGLLFSVIPAAAHHAFAAEFDAKKESKSPGRSPNWSGRIRMPGFTST
jgi:hypothetical protein